MAADTINEEVSGLKSAINGKVRMIDNVGDIWKVINVYPENLDISIKFHLSTDYPDKRPEILIMSEKLSTEEICNLQQKVECQSRGLIGRAMLLPMYNFILGSIDCDRLTVTKVKHKSKKKSSKMKAKPDTEIAAEKSPSMKTAVDVINRIQWDDLLSLDDFIVGYLDRFIGVVEKSFAAFTWEDLATVDYSALAIPQHRIQYFKYKTVKVWDKNAKLDNVFGSLGSGVTIYDVIHGYREETTAPKNSETESENETDSDSDNGITVTIRNEVMANGTSDSELEYNDDCDEFWENKLRPNYFLALRVKDRSIHDGVSAIQEHILENDPDYASCCIPPKLLHITICTMRLDTPETVQEVVKALNSARNELKQIVSQSEDLCLTHVDNFHSRVLYVKVDFPEEFLTFVNHIQMCLSERGISMKDGQNFVPHMSIMKISRPFCRDHWSKRKLDPWLYSGFEECKFGHQPIDCLHLCEMGQGRRDDGFYITATSIPLLDSA